MKRCLRFSIVHFTESLELIFLNKYQDMNNVEFEVTEKSKKLSNVNYFKKIKIGNKLLFLFILTKLHQ